MGNLGYIAKNINMRPKKDSKRQKELKENPLKITYFGCKNCGAINTTLIKATDSYYCKFCFNKLHKNKFNKAGD